MALGRGWISLEGNEEEQGQGTGRENSSLKKIFLRFQPAAVSHPGRT